MGIFRIIADDFKWIKEKEDDPNDLCLHGHVVVQIGEERLEDYGTVSATALYLLKSLERNHIKGEEIQMIPCCGHTMFADGNGQCIIMGCSNGTDWTILHDGDNIRLILENGKETIVSLSEYKEEVYKFADKIEDYYKACQPKIIPENEPDRSGYIAFWNEWHERRTK